MRSVDFVILATISRNQISQDDAFTGTEVTCAYAAHHYHCMFQNGSSDL